MGHLMAMKWPISLSNFLEFRNEYVFRAHVLEEETEKTKIFEIGFSSFRK